jgi:hypothetical protein
MGLGLSSKLKTASWAQGHWNTGAANPSRFRRSSRRGLYVQGWGGQLWQLWRRNASRSILPRRSCSATRLGIWDGHLCGWSASFFLVPTLQVRKGRGRHRKIGSRQASSQKKSPVKGSALGRCHVANNSDSLHSIYIHPGKNQRVQGTDFHI